MKYYLLLIYMLFTSVAFSQDIIKLTVPVKIAEEGGTPLIKNLPTADTTAKTPTYLDSYKYKVVNIGDTTVELIAIPFNVKSDYAKIYNNKIFTIAKDDYTRYHEVVKNQNEAIISIGLLTLPIKMRPQKKFSFDSEFNFNSTLNIRFIPIHDDFSFNWQLGAGLGTVGLNTDNASGIEDGKSTDVSTATVLTGFMFQYRNVQFGIYSGFDWINNQENYQWDSHGKPWVSLGIGLNIFKLNIDNDKQTQDAKAIKL